MGNAIWKAFEYSAPVQRYKTWLRQLIGQEIRLRPALEIPTVSDAGWCYDRSRLSDDSIVYSFGVGDNIEFDLALIERTGATVHAFDPTPVSHRTIKEVTLPLQFHFHPWAVAAEDGHLALYPRVRRNGELSDTMYTIESSPDSENHALEVPAYTIEAIMRQLSHSHIDLLKIDVEGAEYQVLGGMLASTLRPQQILVEFHHRHAAFSQRDTRNAVAALEAAGYRIFHVSNNVREVSFLRC